MRLKKPVIAISTVALLALAACGGSGSSTTDTRQTADISEAGAAGSGKDPGRQAPAKPIEGAKKGGTLHVLHNGGINTLDPSEAYYINTLSILQGLVVRSLTQWSYDPETKDMVLVPDLATDLGTPNKDFTEWTFTIRKGVKFENGQEVTPQDIKFGIERSLDRKTFPSGAGYSNDYFLNGDTYTGPYGKDKGKDYKGVEIHGQKVTIKMSRPFPDMPYWGTFPAISPIPEGDASKPSKYRLHPLATGPYMFKEYTPQKSLTLARNPEWDPDTDPARRQYIDKIVFDFDVTSSKLDQIMLRDNGQAKTSISIDSVLRSDYAQFPKKRLVTGPYPCTTFLDPDNRKITNINVRRAIGYAFPYKDYFAAAGDIVGVTAIPATNVMPPGVPGRTKYNPLPGHEPWSTDPDKAKALLKKAGKLGYKLRWAYAKDDPEAVASKDVFAKAMKEAGFDPQPVASTSDTMTTEYKQNINADINLRFASWCSDWPSGGSWFRPIFYTTDLTKEGFAGNYSAFSSDKVDSKIDSIERMPLDQQPKAWNKLDRTIQQKHYPLLVLANSASAMMRGSKVHGFANDPIWGMPTWKQMWIG
ncbi:MAG: ABC transporter substrate-binding protein [Nocardioidaceae bacterium]